MSDIKLLKELCFQGVMPYDLYYICDVTKYTEQVVLFAEIKETTKSMIVIGYYRKPLSIFS